MRSPWARTAVARPSLFHLEHREERLLRDLDVTDLFHPLFAFFLSLEQLALARDIAAVALGGDVLAQRLHRGPRDHPGADRGLDGDLELLRWNKLLHLD